MNAVGSNRRGDLVGGLVPLGHVLLEVPEISKGTSQSRLHGFGEKPIQKMKIYDPSMLIMSLFPWNIFYQERQ
jgi:hypothetical protein